MASSKLPTTANASAVMRAGSQSMADQALAAADCRAPLTGWLDVVPWCFQ